MDTRDTTCWVYGGVTLATADQLRRVEAMARAHTRGDRRRIWLEFDR